MTRWLPWAVRACRPRGFAEISPELAAEKGIKSGGLGYGVVHPRQG